MCQCTYTMVDAAFLASGTTESITVGFCIHATGFVDELAIAVALRDLAPYVAKGNNKYGNP